LSLDVEKKSSSDTTTLRNMVRKKTIGFLKLLKNWYSGARQDGRSLGYWNALRWHSVPLWNQICYYIGKPPRLSPIKVKLHGKPVWLRPQTSDGYIYRQIFRDEEYGDIDANTEVKFVLDCGANIGLASIYFLNRFPGSRVLAIEPDPDNASMCRRNLLPYGERAVVLEGGVWSRCGRLTVFPSEFGSGQKCGMQVRPFQHGDCEKATVDAFDIPSLMAYGGVEQVDILKIDIERSESVLFSSSSELWLPYVRNLVIELHDEECSRVFFSALARYDYRLLSRGDLTYCLDLRQLPPARLPKEAVL
jgi:FkbM family methyltransferase